MIKKFKIKSKVKLINSSLVIETNSLSLESVDIIEKIGLDNVALGNK